MSMSRNDRSKGPPIALVHSLTTLLVVTLASFMVFAATPALAKGKVYRCGNAFQDRPCPEPKLADARPGVTAPATTAPREPVPCGATRAGVRGDATDCVAKSAKDSTASAPTK